MKIPVRICCLPHNEGLDFPAYATIGAAGMDLLAAIYGHVIIEPGERRLIPTGLTIALPAGYELQIRPRSGLALKNGIMVANSPGTIDEDYRGEIGVILFNAGQKAFGIDRGMRIAQAVLAPVLQVSWVEVDTLDETVRGVGGFGSTG
jgi:dUTP pyrophosphatase